MDEYDDIRRYGRNDYDEEGIELQNYDNNINEESNFIENNEQFIEELEENNNVEHSRCYTCKKKMDQCFGNVIFKRVIQIISFIFAALTLVMYIVSTYFSKEKFFWFKYFTYFVCCFFMLETLLALYLAHNKCSFLFSFETLSNLLGCIFLFMADIDNNFLQKVVETSYGLLIFRITQFISSNTVIRENEVGPKITLIVLSFVDVIVFSSLFFRAMEIETLRKYIEKDPTNQSLKYQTEFHDYFYFSIITISTIGYGDIIPITEGGRIAVMFLILVGVYLIPTRVNSLIQLLNNVSYYARSRYSSKADTTHLVLVGNVDHTSLETFSDELFHPDHGQGKKNAVVLNSLIPDQKMILFLHSKKAEGMVHYLKGDPSESKHMERTDILKSKACVVMTDKYSSNPNFVDQKNITIALQIKEYFGTRDITDFPLFIQLIKPENKKNYEQGLKGFNLKNQNLYDRLIVVEEIKMNLLSKSCLIPGIIPMIANLVRSCGSAKEPDIIWQREYFDGMENEIYRAKLHESFRGNSFSSIAKIIYTKFEAITFAFEIEVKGKTTIILNPAHFQISKSIFEREDFIFYIYVICSDKSVVELIERAGKKRKKKEQSVQSLINSFSLAGMTFTNEDMELLEEDDQTSSGLNEEEKDYFILPNVVNNNVDVKKDSIYRSDIYKNHIVVCGTHPSLYYFILPLRAKYLGKENLKYIVILTKDMPKDLWDSISRFEKIILINGSPLEPNDLYRANITYADKAVILENRSEGKWSHLGNDDDDETILIYKAIKLCNPKIQVLTELMSDSNIKYLLPKSEIEQMDKENNSTAYESTSAFSSGEVYFSSLIDTLTCQAYYNKHIVTIIHQILTEGKITTNYYIQGILRAFNLKSSNLWQIDIPERFIGLEFQDLFNEFCDKGLIALGLYRLAGARDNQNSYVYTKPNPSTSLSHKDKIFVLGPESMKEYKFNNENIVQENNWNNSNENSVIEEEETERIKENMEMEEHNARFTPYRAIEDGLDEAHNKIKNSRMQMEALFSLVKEGITTGISQEIASILQ